MSDAAVSPKSRKYMYIDGLKGLACFFVMAGHFINVYKFSQSFSPELPWLELLLGSPFKLAVNASFWLYLFYVISGFLVAQSRVETIGEYVKKCVGRFLRLALPILFAYLVIFGIYKLIGFHNFETTELFQCNWYQKSFYRGTYDLMTVLRSPIDVLFKGSALLNTPYWVLRMMFVSSLIIYTLSYVGGLLGKKSPALEYFVWFAALHGALSLDNIVAACLLGMFAARFIRRGGELIRDPAFCFFSVLTIPRFYSLPAELLWTLSFVPLLLCVPRVKRLDKVLSSRPFRFLGTVSWGIYSFHWPLISSVGALMLLALCPRFGLRAAYWMCLAAMTALTILVSYLFSISLERLANRICGAANRLMSRVLG